MLKRLFKRCKHEYGIIDSYNDYYTDDYGRNHYYLMHILFCPKCNKEKHVDAQEYKIENLKKQLIKEYNKQQQQEE